MIVRQVTGPVAAPVTLAEIKAHCVVDFDDDDTLLTSLGAAAARSISAWSGRVLTTEVWSVSFAAGFCGDLVLPKSPVQSVDAITYFDADDVEQTASVADFYLTQGEDRAFLRPKAGISWPSANSRRADAITVQFTAGYSTGLDNLKTAVLAMTAHLYEHREAVGDTALAEIPLGVAALIEPDKLGWVAA